MPVLDVLTADPEAVSHTCPVGSWPLTPPPVFSTAMACVTASTRVCHAASAPSQQPQHRHVHTRAPHTRAATQPTGGSTLGALLHSIDRPHGRHQRAAREGSDPLNDDGAPHRLRGPMHVAADGGCRHNGCGGGLPAR